MEIIMIEGQDVFDCWVDEDGNEVTADTIVTRDMTLTARYKPRMVTVTFAGARQRVIPAGSGRHEIPAGTSLPNFPAPPPGHEWVAVVPGDGYELVVNAASVFWVSMDIYPRPVQGSQWPASPTNMTYRLFPDEFRPYATIGRYHPVLDPYYPPSWTMEDYAGAYYYKYALPNQSRSVSHIVDFRDVELKFDTDVQLDNNAYVYLSCLGPPPVPGGHMTPNEYGLVCGRGMQGTWRVYARYASNVPADDRNSVFSWFPLDKSNGFPVSPEVGGSSIDIFTPDDDTPINGVYTYRDSSRVRISVAMDGIYLKGKMEREVGQRLSGNWQPIYRTEMVLEGADFSGTQEDPNESNPVGEFYAAVSFVPYPSVRPPSDTAPRDAFFNNVRLTEGRAFHNSNWSNPAGGDRWPSNLHWTLLYETRNITHNQQGEDEEIQIDYRAMKR